MKAPHARTVVAIVIADYSRTPFKDSGSGRVISQSACSPLCPPSRSGAFRVLAISSREDAGAMTYHYDEQVATSFFARRSFSGSVRRCAVLRRMTIQFECSGILIFRSKILGGFRVRIPTRRAVRRKPCTCWAASLWPFP